ncbi:unnamed protein product [Calypogeia fissa]
MLPTGFPFVFGFQRRENQEEHDDDAENTESELPPEYQSRIPLLGSCSCDTQTADDVQVKGSIGQAVQKGNSATSSEKTDCSDTEHRGTNAEAMIGTSSSDNISDTIPGFESGRLHTDLDVTEGDSKLLQLESVLFEEEYKGVTGQPKITKPSRDLDGFEAPFEAGVAEFQIPVQQHDEVKGNSQVVHQRKFSSAFGKRKPEGDETEAEFPEQNNCRAVRLNRSPIFGFWRRAHDRQDREDLDSELENSLENGKDKNGISVAASSVIVHSRGKQLQRESRDEGCRPINPIHTNNSFANGMEKNEISVAASSVIVHSRGKQLRRESRDEGCRPNNLIDTKAISLPEELVEKILAMIPYPQVLRTRVLNKSFNKNLSASPGALGFQNQVREVSTKWKHYCPIILNIEKECLEGYDREYNRWQNMPLRIENEVLTNWFSIQKLRGAGSLMCGLFNRSTVFVTNIVTRTWKWLPSRPDMTNPKEIHILPIGSEAYQVLLITKDERKPTQVFCQLYDSRTEVWTVRRSTVSTTLSSSSSVYLNGVLYVMEYDPDDFHDVMKLLSYNVSDGTWTNIPHPFGCMLHEIETFELLVCQTHVVVVLHVRPTWWTTKSSHNTLRNTLMVYKLDPDSLDIREVARGPPESLYATCTLFASDNECIYFGDPQVASSCVVELNVQNREWSCLPAPTCADGSFKNKWATFSFQPGMNPFVSV